MIDKRSVLRMKVPYPSMNDKLAVAAHMYICNDVDIPKYSFVKCQTLKPYMLINNTMKHYCDEEPDIERNPFQRTTRIDCDKMFFTQTVNYHDRLKTSIREDVCEELFLDILAELSKDGHMDIAINEAELISLNHLISRV